MVAVTAGSGVGLGLMIMLFGAFSQSEKTPTAARPVTDGPLQRLGNFIAPATGPFAKERRQAIAIGAPIVGAGMWLLTRVPIFGILAAVFIVLTPTLVLPDAGRKEHLARLRALDAWIRGISARMRSGISLDQALSSSIRDVDVLGPQLHRMAAAIAAGMPSSVAVRAFADEIGDGTFDFACQKLILVSGRSAEGLGEALDSLASAVTKRVEARQAIEVERARPMATARMAIILGLLMFILFPLMQPGFIEPYRTITGQAVFTVLIGCGIGCLMWTRSIARMDPEPRLFGPEAAKAPSSGQGSFFGIGGSKS
jgi:Flp pilus assembly protein TadB